ncbi:hypothetical protein BBF96_02195 [Anoxybacter fermentans]|uniref:Uncharacterized protein n=1 Tax=Anoxybacter fermentans TaxID=1323375 RepID=A0A3S9SVH3_9FIRM|nr:hypothetical protein [Anoxybacter fermentans]AZR72306.1 hypothetical protein BBF96_02195 [Anoxybacter fermentans]
MKKFWVLVLILLTVFVLTIGFTINMESYQAKTQIIAADTVVLQTTDTNVITTDPFLPTDENG